MVLRDLSSIAFPPDFLFSKQVAQSFKFTKYIRGEQSWTCNSVFSFVLLWLTTLRHPHLHRHHNPRHLACR